MITQNYENLIELLKDFYNLTGMKVCIYDREGRELCYYPEKFSIFCSIVRKNTELEEKCKECDSNAISRCIITKKAQIYTCHAGLTECIAPILVNDEISGFIAMGQIRINENIDKNTSAYKLNKLELEKAFNEMKLENMDKTISALHVLEACAGYDKLKYYITKNQNSFKVKLEEYIYSNINNKLTVEILCSYMNVSRVELYREIYELYSTSPAELVKNLRLEYSRKLLLSTNDKVYEIAEKSGFTDYNYYSKLFRKKFGITPLNVRK